MGLFFKQETAYEMRISDWRSDVCSSDLIGILMSNRPEWIVSFLAVHQVGGVVVALNTWATPRELEYALHHADVTIFLTTEGIRSHDYLQRSEERRVGKECVSTCRSRWYQLHSKKTPNPYYHNTQQ